ncbi:MAG: M15 family metallopeptidase [Pseudomonadota bacterium]
MRFVPSAIIALAIVVSPLVWHYGQSHFAPPPNSSIDQGLIDRIAELEQAVEGLSARVDGLDSRTALASRDGDQEYEDDNPNPSASDTLKDAFAQVVLIADRRKVNEGLSVPNSKFLKDLLGLPREDLGDDCQAMTNPKLKGLLATESVGPIRARMLKPALISLRQIFANVQVFEPELYARIKSAGSLCVRRVRGSQTSVSAHAYGLAVDINIDGVLDTLGDGKTQLGLTLLADFFNKEGWIWGAGFGREDSMHFEVSREKLLQWRRLGQI